MITYCVISYINVFPKNESVTNIDMILISNSIYRLLLFSIHKWCVMSLGLSSDNIIPLLENCIIAINILCITEVLCCCNKIHKVGRIQVLFTDIRIIYWAHTWREGCCYLLWTQLCWLSTWPAQYHKQLQTGVEVKWGRHWKQRTET